MVICKTKNHCHHTKADGKFIHTNYTNYNLKKCVLGVHTKITFVLFIQLVLLFT